jgi:CheY-like chemotaxis protein
MDQPSSTSSLPSEPSGALRVLVLEDNAESRLLLRHLLRRDFDATLVGGVDEALAAAQSRSFDIALLDINLGEKRTGVDVLQLLRTMPQHRDLPALACTAYALPGDRERFLNAGFVDYVSKPFVKAELMAALYKAVGVQA